MRLMDSSSSFTLALALPASIIQLSNKSSTVEQSSSSLFSADDGINNVQGTSSMDATKDSNIHQIRVVYVGCKAALNTTNTLPMRLSFSPKTSAKDSVEASSV